MSVASGPDFICIGMQKAGTGWLFDQLQYHPDFWMPPAKEIHYLDRDPPKLLNVVKLLNQARKRPERLEKRFEHRRRWDDRDIAFLEEAASLRGKPVDFERYCALFRFKDGRFSGDVTPGYSGLSEERIAEIAEAMPEARIVLLIRDPVARAWSQISMANRNENFDVSLLEDPRAFRSHLDGWDSLHRHGFPARIAERWDRAAPKVRFRHFFMDDIAAKPDETRRDILSFIGADPMKSSGDLAAGHNRKSKAAKLVMGEEHKRALVDYFADEIRACARRFGGHALAWATSYGLAA
ncbi:MAG TPA: sulfotransferase [Rhizomicrobium sp.]|nr:sulfotransferase [Rhizomicrobium sp.]